MTARDRKTGQAAANQKLTLGPEPMELADRREKGGHMANVSQHADCVSSTLTCKRNLRRSSRCAEQPGTIETSWDGKETRLSSKPRPPRTSTRGSVCVWALLEGKNTMAAKYPSDGFAILARWNRKQIAATGGPHARPRGSRPQGLAAMASGNSVVRAAAGRPC